MPRRKAAASQKSEYVTDLQIAHRYGVHRGTVWRWAQESRIPQPLRLAPGTTRWRLADVVEALEGGAA